MTEQNDWLETYGYQTKELLRELEFYIYQGASDGKLDLKYVYQLLSGSLNETKRLHAEVNELKEDIRNLLKDHSADVKIIR